MSRRDREGINIQINTHKLYKIPSKKKRAGNLVFPAGKIVLHPVLPRGQYMVRTCPASFRCQENALLHRHPELDSRSNSEIQIPRTERQGLLFWRTGWFLLPVCRKLLLPAKRTFRAQRPLPFYLQFAFAIWARFHSALLPPPPRQGNFLARTAGLEPATSGLLGRRSTN